MIKGRAFPAAGWSTERNAQNRASGTALDIPIFFQPSRTVRVAACDRLDSWKQIAVYLEREVRTVQRWEKREGLPVHRQFHLKSGTVYAFKHEVDGWLKSRSRAESAPPPERRYLNHLASWLNLTLLMALQIRTRSLFWLARVAQNSYQLGGDVCVAEVEAAKGQNAVTTALTPGNSGHRTRCRLHALRSPAGVRHFVGDGGRQPC
jgi:hypothetical protein